MNTFASRAVVLLDAGGTLIGLCFDRVRSAVGRSAAHFADETLEAADAKARLWADAAVRRGATTEELWSGYVARLLGGAGLPESEHPAALAALWEANRREGLWRRALPGARETLGRLAASGRRLAVVSNAEGQVEQDLRELGLAEHLETVVDSHLVGVAKPDPAIFAVAFSRMEITANDAFYVGDIPAYDVVGAEAAGLPVVLLDPFGHHAEQPVTRIPSIGELPTLLGL